MSVWASYTSAFRRYGDFDGRTSRGVFWRFFFVNLAISLGLLIAMGLVFASSARPESVAYSSETPPLAVVLLVVLLLYQLGALIPGLAIQVRRLHDVGRSGWWVLLALLGLFGLIPLIIWWARAGEGPNAWGSGGDDGAAVSSAAAPQPAGAAEAPALAPVQSPPAEGDTPSAAFDEVLGAPHDSPVASPQASGGGPRRPSGDLDAILAGRDDPAAGIDAQPLLDIPEAPGEGPDAAHEALRAMIDRRTGGT